MISWLSTFDFFLSQCSMCVCVCSHCNFYFRSCKTNWEKFIRYSPLIFRCIKWAMHNLQSLLVRCAANFCMNSHVLLLVIVFCFFSSFSLSLYFWFSVFAADVRNLFLCLENPFEIVNWAALWLRWYCIVICRFILLFYIYIASHFPHLVCRPINQASATLFCYVTA